MTRVGFERATTNEVARVAGVSIGSLYQYFPNKEALVATLLERHVSVLLALAKSTFAALQSESVPVAIRRLVDSLFELYSVEPALYRVFVEQLPAVGRLKRIVDVERELTLMIREYLEAHRCEVAPPNLDLAAFLVMRTLQALTHGIIAEHPDRLTDPHLAREVSAVIVGYLSLDRGSA